MVIEQQNTIARATSSEGVKMSEIQSLSLRVRDLNQSVDWWNTAMIWGLAVAAIAAVFVVISTRIVVTRAGQLAATQDVLSDAKDRQLQSDLKAKDIEIGNLKLRSDTTEVGILAARTEAANATQKAAAATAAQQRVETDLAKQQEKAATAERALLQLQRRMEPRKISADQRVRLMEILSGGPKGQVAIGCVLGDGEGQTFANDIEGVLKASGWETTGVSQGAYSGGNPIGFGIIVRSATSAPPFASALQRAFFSIGIPMAGAENPQLAEGTVQILVGNKPN